MGLIYARNKPEAESFSYAYVEAADGSFVRVSIDNIKKVLGINTTTSTIITLTATDWVASADGSYFTQILTLDGSTENSRIDLQPTPAQIIQLIQDEASIFVANDDGVITAYSVNATPSTDMVFNATVTEVL